MKAQQAPFNNQLLEQSARIIQQGDVGQEGLAGRNREIAVAGYAGPVAPMAESTAGGVDCPGRSGHDLVGVYPGRGPQAEP